MGTFTILLRRNFEYQFNLKSGNGQVILTSEGYTSKSGCSNGIASVRINSKIDGNYERKMSTNYKYYFTLKAANGLVIGTSEMYETSAGRGNGIDSVKSNAPHALVDDTTI